MAERAIVLERELSLLRSIDVPGVVRALGVEDLHGEPTLVLEDPDGVPVASLCSRTTTLDEKVQVALAMACTVAALHRAGVMHRDLRPDAFVWSGETSAVTLIDLRWATRATHPTTSVEERATWARAEYAAPELTGRGEASVDRRCDLYALGGTLFHLFAGHPPFVGVDVAELRHAHVARLAPRLDALVPEVPTVVASIVARLLEKDPSARYQSADALEADLRRAAAGEREHCVASGGRGALRLGDRVVGRDREIDLLEELVREIAARRGVLGYVSGEAGVGKTALLSELARRVAQRGGVVARGKFEIATGEPYHALTQAMTGLAGVLLSAPEAAVEELRDALEGMSTLAPALLDVFPTLRPLFRGVGAATPAAAAESRNRLVAAFVAFLEVVASVRQNVLILVDDMQWADAASVELLDVLARGLVRTPMALVVAARDDEVPPGGPVALLLASLQAADARLVHVPVAPLEHEALSALLARALDKRASAVERLARVIGRKTRGNPFFVVTLIESAIDGRLITRGDDGFVWSDDEVEAWPITDQLATLLAEILGRLPPATQSVLAIAARVSEPIELSLVAHALEVPEAEVVARLSPAVEHGLVHLRGAAIRFAHDRVIEAALSRVGDEESRAIHGRLAVILLEAAQATGRDARVIEAVEHLFRSSPPRDEAERSRRSVLALRAARLAFGARAFGTANRSFARYADHLDARAFEERFDETFDAHHAWAEAAFLSGDYERAETLLAQLDHHARDSAHRLRVRRTLIDLHEKKYRFLEAIRVSFDTLAEAGVALPDLDRIGVDDVQAEVRRFKELLPSFDVERAPLCASASARDAIAMLVSVAVPIWSARPEALPLVLARAATLTCQEGLAPASGAGLVLLASMLCFALDDPEVGVQTAAIGRRAQERTAHPDYECLTLFAFHTMVEFHTESAAAGREGLRAGYERGLAVGNRQWASYCADQYPLRGILIGLPLAEVAADVDTTRPNLLRLEQEDSITHAEPQAHFVERMLGRAETPWNLGNRAVDEATALAALRASNHRGPLLLHTTLKVLELMAAAEHGRAYELVRAEESLLFQPSGQLQTELGLLLFALSVTLSAPRFDASLEAAVGGIHDRFARLARHPNTSFGGYRALVDAARLARTGDIERAATACERALDVFERDRVLPLSALAHELAARVQDRAKRPRAARFHREAAREAYRWWGAGRAVRRLDTELGLAADARSTGDANVTSPAPVDVVSLLKAARAIASELELDRLIVSLLRILAENAGANRAHLFLMREREHLRLEARCDAALEVVRVRPEERPLATCAPFSVARVVATTREVLVLDDASRSARFAHDAYLLERGSVSMLAAPIERHDGVTGVVILENDLVAGAFSPRHAEVVRALAAEIAIALENATLYAALQETTVSLEASNARVRDIADERARAQIALGESEALLRHLQKTEAVGRFATGIAHDFNNILTVVCGCSRLLLETLDTKDPARRLAENIRQAGDSAAALTRQLLSLGRREAVVPRALSLAAVVREMVPLLRRLLPARVKLDARGDDVDDVIWADRGQLDQILLNLIVNARDAMPNGGTLDLAVAAPTKGGGVCLRVRDSGIGMDEETKARIFEPFFTTKARGEGTGLGLSTVRGIVEDLGATIEVTSARGEGTTFEITFRCFEERNV